MNLVFSGETLSSLYKLEQETAQKYRKALAPYLSYIPELGLSYEMYMAWKNTQSGNLYNDRPPINDGYAAFIVFKIKKQSGKIVESTDHDVYMDYSWIVSEYSNGIIHVYDDVNEEATTTLEDCIIYLQNPY